MVVKKDNSREVFDREKIKRGIIKSCEKRPVSIEQIESIISYVENEINKNYISEINTDKIGEMVMDKLKDIDVDDKEFVKIEAIITSMTAKERKNPSLLNASRRKRIAKGSGTEVHDINKFMETFEVTQKMMKQLKTKGGMKRMMKGLKLDQMDEFKDLM